LESKVKSLRRALSTANIDPTIKIMSNNSDNDPPITRRDRECAAFARAALFPMIVDWDGKHHAIYPALQVLEGIRKDAVNLFQTPFSALFPRRVVLVPSASGMQWNGQPNIIDSSVEVIPDRLTIKCMECSKGDFRTAFVRSRQASQYSSDTDAKCHEIVLCTNRLLKGDIKASKDSSSSSSLLDQRKDLPPRSLKAVEEALAHQLSIVRDQHFSAAPSPAQQTDSSPCQQYAELELRAAKVAECMFEQKGSEVRRGSRLLPPGFSWLPGELQQNLQHRCIRSVATQATGREFGVPQGKQCVKQVLAAKRQ
jgi:hypothetical protein